MKKIFIHIGLHKTGSTTLQAFLTKNRKALYHSGYLYPEMGVPSRFMAHHNLAWLLKKDKRADITWGTWKELYQEIEKSEQNNIIVSSEDFESANIKFVNRLKSKLESYNVNIIVYIRRQDKQLESQYTQHIKDGLYSGDILSFWEKLKAQSDLYQLLKPWKQMFGINNIIVRPLEKEQIPDICHDFLKQIGVDNFDNFSSVNNRNIKPGRKTLEVLKFVNKLYENRPKKIKKEYLRNIVDFTSKEWSEERNYRLLSYSEAFNILEWYKKSNQAVAQEYLGRKDGVLFYEELEPYDNHKFDIEELSKKELLSLITVVLDKNLENLTNKELLRLVLAVESTKKETVSDFKQIEVEEIKHINVNTNNPIDSFRSRESDREIKKREKIVSGITIDMVKARRQLKEVEDEIFWNAVEIAAPYTLLTIEKLYNLYDAVCYVSERAIAGDFVECGVFKGGAILLMAQALIAHGYSPRPIHLFDTFFGFTDQRSKYDITYDGKEIGKFKTQNFRQEVENNLKLVSYPSNFYVFVEGDVIATSRNACPDAIAILRLDTDTYETTKAELENMFPKLSPGGVLIIDDYGYSRGCKEAVDEFFAKNNVYKLFLQRPNQGSRTAVKF